MQTESAHPQRTSGVLGTLSSSIARNWPLWFILATGIWVGVPWLAPVFMTLGWEGLARSIYTIYSYQCHQLPQRSFFLFGPESMYELSSIQAVWTDSIDPLVLRKFVGNAQLGYKLAWSDRMVSAYSSIPLSALVWWVLRKRLRPLPFWGMVLLMLPMGIDGVTHMVSDLSGIGQGFRYTNQWLASLTASSLPESFYLGTVLGSFNSWMRLITGVLFGVGLIWFALPRLALVTSQASNPQRQVQLTADGGRQA